MIESSKTKKDQWQYKVKYLVFTQKHSFSSGTLKIGFNGSCSQRRNDQGDMIIRRIPTAASKAVNWTCFRPFLAESYREQPSKAIKLQSEDTSHPPNFGESLRAKTKPKKKPEGFFNCSCDESITCQWLCAVVVPVSILVGEISAKSKMFSFFSSQNTFCSVSHSDFVIFWLFDKQI